MIPKVFLERPARKVCDRQAWIAGTDKIFQKHLERRGQNKELRYVCFSVCEFSKDLLPKICFISWKSLRVKQTTLTFSHLSMDEVTL